MTKSQNTTLRTRLLRLEDAFLSLLELNGSLFRQTEKHESAINRFNAYIELQRNRQNQEGAHK